MPNGFIIILIIFLSFYFASCAKVSETVCDLKIDRANTVVDCDSGTVSDRGLDHFKKKEYDKALREFDKAIAMKPDSAEIYMYRGAVYNQQDKFNKALAEYNKAIIIDPEFGLAYFNRGSLHRYQGNYKKAIDDFDRAIKFSTDSSFYSSRAGAHMSLGNHKPALADLNKAIQLNPANAQAFNYRGRLYLAQNKIKKAMVDFNKSIDLDPNDWEVFYFRALLYVEVKKSNLALLEFDHAIQLGTNSPHVYLDRAKLYIKLKKYAAARTDLQHALRTDMNGKLKIKITNIISWMHSTHPEKTIRDGEQAFKLAFDNILNSPTANYFDTFASAYAELGDFDAAIGYQKYAFELAKQEGKKWLIDEANEHLKQYKKKKPWRE